MATFPESHLDLLKAETRAYAFLATTMKDGSPQVTPVWFDIDGEHIRINTAKGRTKDRNMRARPRVALVIVEPANPYRYMQIRGRVVGSTEENAQAHINALAQKYTGENWKTPPGEVRVIFTIQPERISVMA